MSRQQKYQLKLQQFPYAHPTIFIHAPSLISICMNLRNLKQELGTFGARTTGPGSLIKQRNENAMRAAVQVMFRTLPN